MTPQRGERTSACAEDLAAQALAFLAEDPDRLGAFLAEAGLDGASIRRAAAEPGFLPAVMEHILRADALIVGFAAAAGTTPQAVVRAARALGVAPWERGEA